MARGEITPLGIKALALLDELGEMHPYEVYQLLLQRESDQIVKLSAGTLYHTINRLAAHGLVRVTGTGRQGNRPEHTAYEITPTGVQALRNRVTELLADPPEEYPIFPVVVAEIHHLPPDVAVSLLRRRAERLESSRRLAADQLTTALTRGVPRRFLLGVDYQVARLEADIAWIRRLIDDIESDALDWTGRETPTPTDDTTHPAAAASRQAASPEETR